MITKPACVKSKWNGREAYTLSNERVQVVTLPGGGHIAEFRFRESTGLPVLNPLWVPVWKTIEPYQYRAEKHTKLYGPINDGKLLSGICGHNICLDYFGPPSEEEAAQGLFDALGRHPRRSGRRPNSAPRRRSPASPSGSVCRWRDCASAGNCGFALANPWPISPRP